MLFDLNGDGRLSPDELFLQWMVMRECTKQDNEPERWEYDDPIWTPDAERGLPTDPKPEPEPEPDYSWRIDCYGEYTWADPDLFETYEDYRSDCNMVIRTFTQLFEKELDELSEQYDIRIAAAIIYMGLNGARPESAKFQCLENVLAPYGLEMRTVQSVCAQLEKGIRYTNEHPGEQRDFTIDLT